MTPFRIPDHPFGYLRIALPGCEPVDYAYLGLETYGGRDYAVLMPEDTEAQRLVTVLELADPGDIDDDNEVYAPVPDPAVRQAVFAQYLQRKGNEYGFVLAE